MMHIALAQLNPTIGDLQYNVDNLLKAVDKAQADLVVAPELAITGYPPKDLLEQPHFIKAAFAAVERLITQIGEKALLVGSVVAAKGDPLTFTDRLSNGALLIHRHKIIACHRKILLPTYDVFDESRYFVPGDVATVVDFLGTRIGISVCEDIWNDKDFWHSPRYERDPLSEQIALGAKLLINLSASPFERDKPLQRFKMLQAAARKHQVPIVYVNQLGGNDSLVFDGSSVMLDAQGKPLQHAESFQDDEVIEALCLGLQDYLRKCGFSKVIIGLSGGIDSALVAALAVRALGAENVMGIAMPSRYSSQGSIDDALALAKNLNIRCDVISIEPMFASYLKALEQPFAGLKENVTEENLQARIRGNLLMAYSNKFGSLLLTTGNKSELAVGYCTLYGDMCGGLALISDLYKTEVFKMAAQFKHVIPSSTLTKPPSAELRPNQKDEDSLPPYDVLDAVLKLYIDNKSDLNEIIAKGFDAALVERIVRMVDRAEYKRKQMPPGIKVSPKAFGEGRRLPIARHIA